MYPEVHKMPRNQAGMDGEMTKDSTWHGRRCVSCGNLAHKERLLQKVDTEEYHFPVEYPIQAIVSQNRPAET